MSSGLSLYEVCLDASTSNIAISDGTNTAGVDANGALCTKIQDSNGDVLAINADGSLNVVSASTPKLSAMQTTDVDVTTTAAEVVATPLAGRCGVIIQNIGNQPVYLGEDATVTAATGICIPGKSSFQYDFGDAVDLFLIAQSGTQDVRILEVA